LWDVGVDVERAQLVAARGQRVDEALLGEAVAGLGPSVVIGGRGQV